MQSDPTVLTESDRATKSRSQGDRGIEAKRAETESPRTGEAYLRTGEAHEASGDYNKAFEAYLAAWAGGLDLPEVAAALLREELLLKTYPRSIEQLAKIAARRQSVQIWRLLARVCEAKEDYDRATAFLTEAIQTQADDVASLSILARISEKRHGAKEAVLWHRRILAINPRVRASQYFIARWHYERGEYAEAIPYFERLFFRERGNRVCELYWLLANVHCYGIHGLEKRLAAVEQWSDLKAEEQPLVQELFILAGKQSLKEGETTRAEHYIAKAQYAFSSQDQTLLLSVSDKDKPDAARDARVPAPPLPAPEHEFSDLDTFILSWAHSLYEENRRRRRAIARRLRIWGSAIVLIVAGAFGYQCMQRFQAASLLESAVSLVESEQPSSSHEQVASLLLPERTHTGSPENGLTQRLKSFPQDTDTGASALRRGEQREVANTPPPSNTGNLHGKVVSATESEIQISGKGAKHRHRTPVVMRQTVDKYLPELQEAYEKGRAADPLLSGSLVLDLTIASSGEVSRVDFQSTRLNSKTFQETIGALAQKWRFPPASGAVKVSYPLFFLPPNMESASLPAWEKRAAAQEAPRENLQAERKKPEGGVVDQRAGTEKRQAIEEQKLAAIHPSGVYKVISATPLRSRPQATAQVLAYLQPRTQVTIVGMSGDYLAVRSVEGNPSHGYVYWEDVTFMYDRS